LRVRPIPYVLCVAFLITSVVGVGWVLFKFVTRRHEDLPLPDLKGVTTTALGGHGKDVGSAGFSPDGKFVATGCYDRKVRVFDTATGKELHAFDFGDDVNNAKDQLGVRTQGLQMGVAFDRESKRLAAVGGSWMPSACLVTVFDLTAKKVVFTSRAHKGMAHGAGFSGDGKLLVTAGHDSTLKVFAAVSGEERGTFRGHDWVVTAMTFSPDGRTVASACCNSQERSVRLWDPKTLEESQNIPLPDRIIALHDLAFSPDGKHLAGVSNWRLHVWEVATGKPAAAAALDAGLFKRIAYSPDGRRVAAAGGQGSVDDGKGILRVYDVAADRVHLAFARAGTGGELIAVAWPTADTILAVGARGSDAKLVTVKLR
jgi:WD40 repeat protein